MNLFIFFKKDKKITDKLKQLKIDGYRKFI